MKPADPMVLVSHKLIYFKYKKQPEICAIFYLQKEGGHTPVFYTLKGKPTFYIDLLSRDVARLPEELLLFYREQYKKDRKLEKDTNRKS